MKEIVAIIGGVLLLLNTLFLPKVGLHFLPSSHSYILPDVSRPIVVEFEQIEVESGKEVSSQILILPSGKCKVVLSSEGLPTLSLAGSYTIVEDKVLLNIEGNLITLKFRRDGVVVYDKEIKVVGRWRYADLELEGGG